MDAGEQLSLNYAPRAAREPGPGVDELIAYLQGRGWLSASQISAATGWDDRQVRELAAEADMVISAPGRTGYKYLGDATRDEYDRYRNARRSQARKMVAKVIRTDRIFYRRAAATVS